MVVYALTDKCNLNCMFCSNEDFKVYFKPQNYKPPSFDEIKEWFEKVNVDEDNITLTGGEPTLREDLFDALDYLRQKFKKANIILLTNGRRFVYEDFAKKFSTYNNFEIEIPLNSHIPEIHDKLTDCPGSFDQTLNGIRNLLNNSITVNIRIVINKYNYQELLDFMKFIKSIKGINKVVFINMRIKGRAVENNEQLVIEYAKVRPYISKALAFLDKNKIKMQLLHFPFCILDKKYWDYTLQNPYKAEAAVCSACIVRQQCPGILDCYLKYVGEKEFKAIK